MYSSKRFRANKAAINQSCRFMYITSSLSEGEKTCSLRSRKEATATGRQCLHPTDSVVANAFCLASVATKRCAPRCLVFPRSREIATLLLYKESQPLSSLCYQKGCKSSDKNPPETENFPARQLPKKPARNFADPIGGCRAGKFGGGRGDWGEGDPLRKGVALSPRSFFPSDLGSHLTPSR